ncbi:MAG: GNAT family N-acetyltransferase [Muribaculaceae bacterium]|nr:GNAT family N-acetyltransferase [Muribaculaceae bacterium]
MTEQEIIAPVSLELIESELTPERFLRNTNKGHNQLFIVDAHTAPNIMREIGRLREIAFRQAGGGTGKDCDIDEYDLMEPPCRQLIVWDPENKLILGGYRFIFGKDIRFNPDGSPRLATAHMFNFSPDFIENYLPYTMELGRSFVRLEYQSSRAGAKAIFALDNLWDGLGALTVIHSEIRYLFGKMTMYPTYSRHCRDMILYFLRKYFPDPERLVVPINPIVPETEAKYLDSMFVGGSFKEDYRILNQEVRSHGLNIPPLVNAYMSLSPTMHVLGTAINDLFGNVEETGILIAVDEIFEEKKRRHIESYNQEDHLN